jgi:diadenosine tetraphosphate (Ap4A) HIT family hydrolase
MSDHVESIFLNVDSKHRVVENDLAFALYDIHPVSKGHLLIIPKRVFMDFFEASPEEVQAIHELLVRGRDLLMERYQPDGFNIGVNVGGIAGQTVWHAHVHLIPRYRNQPSVDREVVEGLS